MLRNDVHFNVKDGKILLFHAKNAILSNFNINAMWKTESNV